MAIGGPACGLVPGTRRPRRVTEPFSVPCRTAVQAGSCLPVTPATAVTSASNMACTTDMPVATLNASDQLTATGEVRASGARITGQLSLQGATLTNPDGNALTLERLQVDLLIFDNALDVKGALNLIRAQIGGLAMGRPAPDPSGRTRLAGAGPV